MKYKHMNITLDITTKCNLHCKHCRTNEIDHELSIAEVKTIVKKCKEFKPRCVFISGGEPLTRADIVEVVKEIKKLAPIVELNTNSLLLTEKLLKQLIDAGLNYIQVSIDGIEKYHDFIRGKGTYKKTIKQLKLINKYSDKIKLHLNSVVSSVNIDGMKDLVHQIIDVEKIDVEIFGFKRFIPNNELKGKGNLGKEGLQKMYKTMLNLQEEYKEKTIIAADMPMKNVDQKDRVLEIMDKYKLTCAGCSAGVNGISIRNDGTVTPCTLLYISCGNILTQNLDDIMNNIDIQKIIARDLKGRCGDCEHKYICGGCRACAYQLTGDFLSEDLECFI